MRYGVKHFFVRKKILFIIKMKHPSAPLYPELSDNGKNYRLQKICEIEKTLINERDVRKALYKKYKRGLNISDGLDTGLVSISVILAGIGFVVPVLMPLEVASVVCGSLGIFVKFLRRKLTSKAQKHYEIKTIADSKLNSVKDLISRALADGEINEKEFKMILDELEKYNKIKENLHSKQTGLSETDKKKLIQQGKDLAMTEIKKKIGDV